jgi:hypothetical protein
MILRTPHLAAAFLLAASPALAEPVWTNAPSVMRRAPNPAARVVQEIPPSAQIYLKSCRGDWCYASWRNRSGYIPAYAVAEEAPPSDFGAPPVGGGAVVVGPPPVAGPGFGWGGPYVGGGWGWQRW